MITNLTWVTLSTIQDTLEQTISNIHVGYAGLSIIYNRLAYTLVTHFPMWSVNPPWKIYISTFPANSYAPYITPHAWAYNYTGLFRLHIWSVSMRAKRKNYLAWNEPCRTYCGQTPCSRVRLVRSGVQPATMKALQMKLDFLRLLQVPHH